MPYGCDHESIASPLMMIRNYPCLTHMQHVMDHYDLFQELNKYWVHDALQQRYLFIHITQFPFTASF
jgi:hypothetical protein